VGFLAASFIAVVWYAVVTHGMANTVAEQTRISRQVFESTHRPSIEIIVPPGVTAFYENQNNYTFPFQLYNRGEVPAILVSWQGIVRQNGIPVLQGPLNDNGYTIFPTREPQFNFANVHGPQAPTPAGVEIEIVVRYHAPSAPDRIYMTRMNALPPPPHWRYRFPEIT